ncbi:MAG: glycine cleavage system aminomethyltransferase GcvT [Candidatus Delongbacteria bacterium]|nr:glycine cleavage system aminomethyltransferase GcvT [Candidatus Delongbacteria bacterium]MBN2834537.1 glycine cleavage system aminomethyltransferase GcvT [Candidatus Delongbacteria bacterium]
MKTVLYDEHVKLGGKVVDFAGWEMPLWYTKGQSVEHHATRKNVGLFDICHMGEFRVTGKDSKEFFSRLLSNNINSMVDGQAMYNFMHNEKGGVIDDCIVYRFEEERWMLVVNAGNIDIDFDWLKSHCFGDVKIENLSDVMGKLDLQGPNAPKLIKKLAGEDAVAGLGFFKARENVNLDGIEIILSRTGYTGEIGFELYVDIDKTVELWNKLLTAGEEFGIEPCGLGARDSLRTEAGLPLHGHEIHPEVPSIETPWAFVFDWDHEFIGKEALVKYREEGVKTFVYPFVMNGRSKAMPEWDAYKDGEKIGVVLSGVISPTLENKPIGFLRSTIALEEGTLLSFKKEDSKRVLEGEISKSPFVAPTSRKKMKSFL